MKIFSIFFIFFIFFILFTTVYAGGKTCYTTIAGKKCFSTSVYQGELGYQEREREKNKRIKKLLQKKAVESCVERNRKEMFISILDMDEILRAGFQKKCLKNLGFDVEIETILKLSNNNNKEKKKKKKKKGYSKKEIKKLVRSEEIKSCTKKKMRKIGIPERFIKDNSQALKYMYWDDCLKESGIKIDSAMLMSVELDGR